MENVALVFEVVGVAIIVIGGIGALIVGIKDFTHLDRLFFDVRRSFGRPIILGLEVLVAADIIKTITVDPSLESVAVLGILVAVRIALEHLARHRGRRDGAVAASADRAGTRGVGRPVVVHADERPDAAAASERRAVAPA